MSEEEVELALLAPLVMSATLLWFHEFMNFNIQSKQDQLTSFGLVSSFISFFFLTFIKELMDKNIKIPVLVVNAEWSGQ